MQSYSFIKSILIFFFLLGQIRVWLNLTTGNDFIGALADDVVIVGLVLFYATFSLSVRETSELRLDRVKLFLLAVLVLAFLQVAYFTITFPGEMSTVIYIALYSFRKFFMPLALFFIFSYLIRNEIIKNGEMFIKRLVKLFAIFLWVAIFYNLFEGALRELIPAFNSFYINYVSSRSLSGPIALVTDDIRIAVLWHSVGISIKRVYGIWLEMYVSGAMIFLLYLFHVFMSGKFRVLSILNGFVFIALVLSGSRTYMIPFLVLNIVFFIRQHVGRTFFSPILISMFLVGWISFMLYFMKPAFEVGSGFFWYVQVAIEQIPQHWKLFIFGTGPVGFSPWGDTISWTGDLSYTVFRVMAAMGLLMVMLEAGFLMSVLFVLFHVFVFRKSRNISGISQTCGQYTKGLKILIAINMLVTLIHWPVLFDKTMIVFHVFLVTLLYSWSRFRRASFVAASENPLSCQKADFSALPKKA